MSKIMAADLVADFQVMLREHWAYAWSGSEKGKVSCSGAFSYAFRKHGLSIYQGSNRIARRYVVRLIPFAEAKAQGLIVPGMAAFKQRKPGAKNYALPEAYKPGGAYYDGDLSDYYHIGLVDSDVGYVLNAQSTATGFVRSKITENWSHVAQLSAVDYGSKTEVSKMQAKVTGGRLKLRKAASTSADVILSIESGTVVEVIDLVNDDWARVIADGRQGYVARQFLIMDGQKQPEQEEPAPRVSKVQLLGMLEHAETALSELRRLIDAM